MTVFEEGHLEPRAYELKLDGAMVVRQLKPGRQKASHTGSLSKFQALSVPIHAIRG
jgi:hypothetical protein